MVEPVIVEAVLVEFIDDGMAEKVGNAEERVEELVSMAGVDVSIGPETEEDEVGVSFCESTYLQPLRFL